MAVESLTRLGIDLGTLRQQVEESIGHGPGAPAGQPIRPSRPRGMKVLDSALPEALGYGHNYTGTEHLLLAQFHDDGPAARPARPRLRRARARKGRAREEETERLRLEVVRLRELLLRHGIQPGHSDEASA